uniref:Hydrolase n=1 Tax=Echinostoma caproni TaxID=27848 RepID=A0A183B2H8_9TREM
LEAECLAQRLGDHQYVETSSITGQNIEKSVQMMAEVVYRNVVEGFYEEFPKLHVDVVNVAGIGHVFCFERRAKPVVMIRGTTAAVFYGDTTND